MRLGIPPAQLITFAFLLGLPAALADPNVVNTKMQLVKRHHIGRAGAGAGVGTKTTNGGQTGSLTQQDSLSGTNQGEGSQTNSDDAGVVQDSLEAKQHCIALAETFQLRSGQRLLLPFSQYYPQGSNPSMEALTDAYPTGIIPADVDVKSILPSVGPDFEPSQESGYGYQSLFHARIASDGGLPAFCRFGAMLQTSISTKILSEVWMPLAENPAMPVMSSTEKDPVSSTTGTDNVGNVGDKKTTAGTVNNEKTTEQQMTEKQNNEETSKEAPTTTPTTTTAETTKRGLGSDSGGTSGFDVFGSRHGGWDGRLLEVGNGGQRGFVPLADMKQMMARYRFAVAGSNLGHFSTTPSSTWVNGSMYADTLLDWSTRAHHVTRMLSEEVVESFYGQFNRRKDCGGVRNKQTGRLRSYHVGCSNGGARALAAAQDQPLDHDGILAGAPTLYFSDMNLGQLHQQSVFNKSIAGDGFFSRDFSYKQVRQLVLDTCDAQDGVKDGVVGDPFHCKPDLTKLLCKDTSSSLDNVAAGGNGITDGNAKPIVQGGGDPTIAKRELNNLQSETLTGQGTQEKTTLAGQPKTLGNDIANKKGGSSSSVSDESSSKTVTTTCLSPAQLANLERFYSPTTIDGKLVYPAWPFGVESGADTYKGKQQKANQWLQLGVQRRDSLDKSLNPFTDFTWADVERGRNQDEANVNSAKSDLSQYLNHGGKAIIYHGLADPVISVAATEQYFRAAQNDGRNNNIEAGVRFYEIPGMQHCRDGPGAWHFGGFSQKDPGNRPLKFDTKHDMILALVDWAERGNAPQDLVAAAYKKKESTGDSSGDDASPSKSKKGSGRTKAASDDDSVGSPIPSYTESYSSGLRFTRKLCPFPSQAHFQVVMKRIRQPTAACKDPPELTFHLLSYHPLSQYLPTPSSASATYTSLRTIHSIVTLSS